MRPEILIVGAGPSGLILALSLLHHGIPVRIIEGRRHQLWNPAIMPRSLEIFKTLGILDDVLDQATDVPHVRLYDEAEKFVEFEVLPHLEPSPGSPFLNVLLLRPDRLERILHAALARLGCSIGQETELVSFEQSCDYVKVKLVKHGDGEHTPVHEEANYTWVVGTDTAAKIVCDLLGLEFMNETKQGDDVIIGEIYYWHVWKCSTNHHVGLRRTGTPGLFAYSLAGQDTNPFQLCEDKKRLVQLLHEGTGKDSHLKFGEILSSSFYPSHIRMVNKLMDGRVSIAGVTAGSVRGQGINIDMEDAFNLAWKLALVHKNVRSIFASEFVLGRTPFSNCGDDWSSDSLFPAGINYRWSSMLLDERRKDTREAAAEDEEYYHDYESDASDSGRGGA
ncbi:hypothetical protein F5887DRAFT_1072120 [Amanita rubescens]|nr:hypothetical protein F5887DRAFT_1072120 [Amanita rubescens]